MQRSLEEVPATCKMNTVFLLVAFFVLLKLQTTYLFSACLAISRATCPLLY